MAAAREPAAQGAWLVAGSVALFGTGVAVYDDLAYGGPLRSGYRPGEVTFSRAAVSANLRYVPAHLIQAMPMLVPGLAALAWIAARRIRLRRADGEPGRAARGDFAVGLALAASWFSVWGLYATYTWTARPGIGAWQTARFYVPAIGAIALLGAWLAVRAPSLIWPRQARLAAVASVAVIMVMFALGIWSFNDMLNPQNPGPPAPPHCNIGEPHCRLAAPPGGPGRSRPPR